MKNIFSTISATTAVTAMFALYSCTTQEATAPKPAPTPAPAAAPAAKAEVQAPPAKATKIAGDVGLLDTDRKSTRLNSSHIQKSRMPSSA